jgi:hypothetical protein
VKRPWLQFFVGDWLTHPGLRSCSLRARAVAIDLVCVMHQAEQYGHLRAGRKDLGPAELARIVGESAAEVESLLRELHDAGVFAVTAAGATFSPRMVRDEQRRLKAKEHGGRGGNPQLIRHDKSGDNPTANPEDNPPHARARSEVRSQKSESSAASKSRRTSGETPDKRVEHAEATRVWCQVFEHGTGKPYAFDGPVDGKQVHRLVRLLDYSPEELERRATLFCRDPYWADRGVDLKRFVSQWTALGNAGRKVDPASNGRAGPTADELAWCRRALEDPNPIVQSEGRATLSRWGMRAEDLEAQP